MLLWKSESQSLKENKEKLKPMHIIVTHVNADFDAVASLLGAHFLYPDALPVLPPTLNRNVRDFVTLYGNNLPFVRQSDLGKKAITRLTIVDTQHMPNLKNIRPDIDIHIIDHHELHHPLTPNITLSLTDTGANATLLVEQLRQTPIRLSTIEATLLLLGIYEDTGSLTYGSTTARDLQAAAWLLSPGKGDLDIVREYLHYALNDIQKELYERLVDSLETRTIHGHNVVIGVATMERYVEEISGLASRIRDLYQPEALFILVEMADHIQMVARSVTNAIDVDHISSYFGGGGHPRAAAALIKDKTLPKTKKELINLLHLDVQPAVTVQNIMSKGVHTFYPTDTVGHAAAMIDRYGHEGFPVVAQESGDIVGILSRRDVDKALRHKLAGTAIYQFMKKGQFFVSPSDSVDVVQRVMTTHQIGQVPVVQDGELLGVVTRTDLINLWQSTSTEDIPPQPNLAEQLQQSLSKPLYDLLCEAGSLAVGQGDTLYLVGGFVRDLLLTLWPNGDMVVGSKISPRFDLDLVVEGNAMALAQHLQEQYGGRVRTHSRFGTAKWILDTPIPFNPEATDVQLASLDFVTARTEFYRHPSALPEVEQSSIKQDLHRRDFTINTLALRLTPDHFGQLLDFYGGQSDLEARWIRVLHNLSFVEDPTRMMRAARIMARVDFTLEERTAELLTDAVELIDRVSGDRVMHELELIFKERQPEKVLQILDDLGIMEAIHPGLVVDEWLLNQMAALQTGLADTAWPNKKPEFVHYVGLMTFLLAHDELEALLERLNIRQHQRTTLKQMYSIKRKAQRIAQAKKASQLYNLLAHTTADARLIVWLALDDETTRQQIVRFQSQLQHIGPLIDGEYLKQELGLRPGPLFKRILDVLRDARLDGEVSTLADERRLAEQIVQDDNGQ